MGKVDIPVLWRQWIMECVSTTTTLILVNGCPTDGFNLQRGLRQGDPLSSFLFMIVVEGLNVMLNHTVKDGYFLIIKLVRQKGYESLTYNNMIKL